MSTERVRGYGYLLVASLAATLELGGEAALDFPLLEPFV